MSSALDARFSQQGRRKSPLDWVKLVFLWAPFARKPGFLTLLWVMTRYTVLALAATLVIFSLGIKTTFLLRSAFWGSWVFLEETARYSFLRKAENLRRATVFFVAGIIATEFLWNLPNYTTLDRYVWVRLPSVAVHLIITPIMAWSITRQKLRLPMFLLMLACHFAFEMWSVYNLSA